MKVFSFSNCDLVITHIILMIELNVFCFHSFFIHPSQFFYTLFPHLAGNNIKFYLIGCRLLQNWVKIKEMLYFIQNTFATAQKVFFLTFFFSFSFCFVVLFFIGGSFSLWSSRNFSIFFLLWCLCFCVCKERKINESIEGNIVKLKCYKF